jgi:hypothetical protein
VGADLFRVVGYGFNTENGLGFRIATFKMYGEALWYGLEFGVSGFEENYDEFLAQVSGIRYSYDPTRAPFSRVTSVEVNGQPLDPAAIYTVTANEFVPLFLDKLGIPYHDLNVITATTEFEVLAAYAAQAQILSPSVEGRVVCAPAVTPRLFVDSKDGRGRQEVVVPAQFALEQNYPNPFNPSTTIAYSLPSVGNVSLKIFNVLGQEVAVLVSGEQGAGKHQVLWNASPMPSGVYFMRLEANNTVAVRKLHLVK